MPERTRGGSLQISLGGRGDAEMITTETYLRLGITRVPSGLMEAGAEFLHTRGLPLGKWTGLAGIQAENSWRGNPEDTSEE